MDVLDDLLLWILVVVVVVVLVASDCFLALASGSRGYSSSKEQTGATTQNEKCHDNFWHVIYPHFVLHNNRMDFFPFFLQCRGMMMVDCRRGQPPRGVHGLVFVRFMMR
jgi:hypothetical protein